MVYNFKLFFQRMMVANVQETKSVSQNEEKGLARAASMHVPGQTPYTFVSIH